MEALQDCFGLGLYYQDKYDITLTLFYTDYLTNAFDTRMGGGQKCPYLTPKPKVIKSHEEHKVWQADWCSPIYFIKIGFELITLRPYFRKKGSYLR